jgi:hypothetical protein
MEGFRIVKKEASSLFKGEIEENTTFYYSNFRLFNESSELMFSKYISFKKDLQAFLGDEWHTYSKKTIFQSFDGTTIYVQSQDIFNHALEIWLELQREVRLNRDHQNKMNSNGDTVMKIDDQTTCDSNDFNEEKKVEDLVFKSPTESLSEDNQMFEVFQRKIRDKFASHEINEVCFKAIIQAFYISASKVWKDMVSGYLLDTSGLGNTGFLYESKKFLLNKLQNLYNTKSKVLKPILVATERIKDYVMDTTKLQNPVEIQTPDDKDMKNFSNFTSNFQTEQSEIPSNSISEAPSNSQSDCPTPSNDSVPDEERELRQNFKTLHITPGSQGGRSVLGKRSAFQAKSVVEIKKTNKKLERLLNQNTIEFAAYYVNNMMKNSNIDWQISRNFVTNMVEVNYNKLAQIESHMTNKVQEIGSNVRIRFIQPAQDFYNQLMETWIIFKAHSLNREILFTEYLEKVKGNLGDLWNERFVAPTQNFFMTLYYEWNHLKQTDTDTEQKVLLFTKKVKESMLKIWEENIVKKAEELSNKTINYNSQ